MPQGLATAREGRVGNWGTGLESWPRKACQVISAHVLIITENTSPHQYLMLSQGYKYFSRKGDHIDFSNISYILFFLLKVTQLLEILAC